MDTDLIRVCGFTTLANYIQLCNIIFIISNVYNMVYAPLYLINLLFNQ